MVSYYSKVQATKAAQAMQQVLLPDPADVWRRATISKPPQMYNLGGSTISK